MEKIPTLFRRDPENPRRLLREVTPGCEWVLAGEGKATRKYDGTCVLFDGTRWWARREVKRGKQPPEHYQEISYDHVTGKWVGWEPVEQSAFAKWHAEALGGWDDEWVPGTYELVGPKVNGNPEAMPEHRLLRHAVASRLNLPELTYEGLSAALVGLRERSGVEGVVWHHPDGRMAKLKARDFPRDTH